MPPTDPLESQPPTDSPTRLHVYQRTEPCVAGASGDVHGFEPRVTAVTKSTRLRCRETRDVGHEEAKHRESLTANCSPAPAAGWPGQHLRKKVLAGPHAPSGSSSSFLAYGCQAPPRPLLEGGQWPVSAPLSHCSPTALTSPNPCK